MGVEALSAEEERFFARLAQAGGRYPGNRSARHLTRARFQALTPALRARVARCCRSGVECPDSEVGCYILQVDDLTDLRTFFAPLIHDLHQGPAPAAGDETDSLDLATLGLPALSLRVRAARNLNGFPMPGAMDRADRVRLERTMVTRLHSVMAHPDYGGRVHSLTPEFGPGEPNPFLIGDTERLALVDAHVMFDDMNADPYLRSAGLAADWPYGRACYLSRDRDVMVWIGEEDHVRVIGLTTGTAMSPLFERLRSVMAVLFPEPETTFVRDAEFGYVTSCPSNIGTGLRASVQMPRAQFFARGVDVAAECAELGLSACGDGGDRTPIPDEGVIEIAPVRRAFVREHDVMRSLFRGLGRLAAAGAAALLLVMLSAAQLSAQTVAIRATGGFLGYLDGFPEFPGWVGDSFDGNPDLRPASTPASASNRPVPYGGLLGVSAFLASHPTPGGAPSLLVIAGNNHPRQMALVRDRTRGIDRRDLPARTHWFWKSMIAMRPDAVGVGTYDLHRWLSQMPPEGLVTWIHEGLEAGLPLVATNVVVRLTRPGLNVVRSPELGLVLEVPEDESLPMLNTAVLKHPCAVAGQLRAATFHFDAGPDVTVKQPSAEDERAERESKSRRARRAVLGDVCRTTLEFSQRLRPGKTYRLASSVTGAAFRFTLTTHQALTPHGAFDGLPVVGASPGGVPMAVMSFVSPSAVKELRPEYFEWNHARGCPADACRIEFLDAAEAARMMLDAMASTDGGAAPMLVGLSELQDTEATALLDKVPELRFLATAPDSGLLGRAAMPVVPATTQQQRYSGDQSFGAIVDQAQPELTRFIVRPTWLGETVVTAMADVRPPVRGGHWRANRAALDFRYVPGASLGWTTGAEGVRYTVAFDPTRFRTSAPPVPADPTAFRPYCAVDAAGPFDAVSHEPQGDLWTNPTSFTGVVLDGMRRSLGADIAIVPAAWIDRDVMAAIAEPPATGVPPLSGFMLQRILYRSRRVVPVVVEGSTLAGLLKEIVGRAAAADDAVCVSGLGSAQRCPLTALETDDLLVNVRKPVDGHYYRIGVPASLARAHGLTYDDHAARDVMVDVDARLAACDASARPLTRHGSDRLAERLESRLAARPQHFVTVDPLTIETASTSVGEPDGARGVFSRLPVDGSGARSSRRIAIDGDINAVLRDTIGYDLRIPVSFHYDRSRVGSATSYDHDEFSVGVRVDRKRFPVRWAQTFGGVFFDGRLFNRVDPVDSVRSLGPIPDPQVPGLTLTDATMPGPTVGFTTAPPRNLAVACGLEVPSRSFGTFTVTGLQLSHAYGRASNVPIAVRLGHERVELLDFLRGDASETLSARVQQQPSGLSDQTPFGYITAARRQSRLQVDATTRTTLHWRGFQSVELSTEHRYRWYRQDERQVALFTERSANTRVTLALGVGKRWSVGPYAEWTAVSVAVKDRRDLRFRVLSGGVQLRLPLFWNGRTLE